MKLPATFYNIREEVIRVIQSQDEPLLLIGMCECGKNFNSRLLVEYLQELSFDNEEILFINTVGTDLITAKIPIENVLNREFDQLKFDELYKWFCKISVTKKVTVIINLGEDEDDNILFLSLMMQIRTTLGERFSFVVVGYIGVMNTIIKTGTLQSYLTRRIIDILPLKGEDLDIMIEYNESLFSVTLNEAQKKYIKLYSGGNLGLVKTLVQQVSEKPYLDSPDFNDPKLISRIHRALEGLTINQIKILDKVIKQPTYIENSEDFALLVRFGFLVKSGDHYKLFTEIIFDTVQAKTSFQSKLTDIRSVLTPLEQKIYSAMQDNMDNVLSRDEISKIIWGADSVEKYSDYAIDKHISNIRRRIELTPFDLEIKTLRGQGFYISRKAL